MHLDACVKPTTFAGLKINQTLQRVMQVSAAYTLEPQCNLNLISNNDSLPGNAG